MGKKPKYEFEVEIKFVPFPSEKRRQEAYRKWVRAFLRAQMRQSKQTARKDPLRPHKFHPAGK